MAVDMLPVDRPRFCEVQCMALVLYILHSVVTAVSNSTGLKRAVCVE